MDIIFRARTCFHPSRIKKKHDLDKLKITFFTTDMLKCLLTCNFAKCRFHTPDPFFFHPADETRSYGYLHPQIQYFWHYVQTLHLGESPSHLTSTDRLHMRPDGQQQEEQVNMGKQPFSQQISHLFLSDSGFDLLLSFLSLFYIFDGFLSLFNPLLFLDLIVFLLFPPPPPPLQ